VDIIAAHAAAPGLFTTRCATHGLVALVIPLNCRDTFLRPPCCARTEEPYAGGAPPLGPGPRLSVDSTGRLAEGATTGAWRGCELNIAAIRATTTERWDRAGGLRGHRRAAHISRGDVGDGVDPHRGECAV
jgi:hypothetical protein